MTHNALPTLHVTFTEGDQGPEIAGVLAGVDLTGQTIRLTLDRPTTVLTIVATITNAPQGRFVFPFAVGDLVTGLRQLSVVRLEDTVGKKQTLTRFLMDVFALPS